jgi:anti-sigma factor RsiW
MNPTCKRVLDDISAYLDGELEQASCRTIEQHCSTCATCSAIVEDLKKTTGLCRQLGVMPLPPAVLDRARASLRRLLEEPPPKQE